MPADLSFLTKEELLGLVAEQRRIITQLQQRIAALEAELKGRHDGKGGMPGNKPASTRQEAPKAGRIPRLEGFARQRSTPTEQVDHAVAVCPDCGTALQGGWVQRTREVLEIPLAPVRVVEHRFIARVCPTCNKHRVVPAAHAGVAIGKQRLGTSVLSLIASLRTVGRLPLATIQWLLETVYQLPLSEGGIVGALNTVARQGQPTVRAIRDRIRASPVVHADETGLREGGKNGYVWIWQTATERYFTRGGRGKGMVDEVLGEGFQGVLVTDFYAAYDHYAGLHQRCWAHLLREIHDLRGLYRDDQRLAAWAEQVRAVYDRGKAVTDPDPRRRQQLQQRLSKDLLAACHPYLTDQVAPQGKLCRRMARYLGELLTFVGDPAVPADNNAAERGLRPLVTQRKISGGTRSPQGTTTAMALATLFGTWRLQGVNPFTACRSLLISPQL
ncbi:MAG: IS66 family transposase [Dehalococcoidia bacterium]|nr:IS66 family transposase [Dehalococcoidia bacterium]